MPNMKFGIQVTGSRVGTVNWRKNLGSTWGDKYTTILGEYDTEADAIAALDKINEICGPTSLKHKVVVVEDYRDLFGH